ncbi:phosphonate C-P lyase system protein PhnG [Oceanicola sp. S124]|uniref:phosphonate C-P lyase system protein PhnG n=1 Tax=Oceanicola sp. S124 TaxID=1042378 RepID=UPI000255903A|nr:phosphonate C-P lyase system protein PhnG [Oceanicola sp. S124]
MFDRNGGEMPSDDLTTLARADAARLKLLAEEILPRLRDMEVLKSGTGLVMLPMRDTVQGVEFHLGEVLVAEAHVRLPSGTEGYGMVTGRDIERAMAMALLDAALSDGIAADRIRAFIEAETQAQQAEDIATLRRIEATRVDMETF